MRRVVLERGRRKSCKGLMEKEGGKLKKTCKTRAKTNISLAAI